jgi:Tfp pilus assembly protein PilE
MLVVVLIIGILAAIALPQYRKAVEKSRAAEALTAIKTLKEAADRYYLATGNYPTKWIDLDIDLPGTVVKGGSGSDDSMVNNLFEYRIYSAIAGVRLGGVAVEKIPRNSAYYLYYASNEDRSPVFDCIVRTDDWKWLCEALGGKYTSGSAPNIRYSL